MAMKVVLVLACVSITFFNLHLSSASELESFSTDTLAHHADLAHHSEELLHSLGTTNPHLHVHHHDLATDFHHDIHHAIHHDVHHDIHVATPQPTGFWKKRFQWKPRWVKTWQEKKIYVGVWKRVWGPVQVTEWVPIPKPPPGWSKHH